MTEVLLEYHNNLIISINVSGHSNYDYSGQDIVCAGISSIVFGGLNALNEHNLDKNNININEAIIKISLNEERDIQIIAQTIIIQLKTIAEKYSNYLNITSKYI
ncbi:MAG: ribosomal-processing cysteine protease Prp [Bacilli bacterium]|jgi:uncharacterized protein YsxB (DUF464 family)|nr:ribosomal-processing cysteine protease Prp [Bacilli bacterium]